MFSNLIPYVGIEYLYENHLLKHDPQDVAQFLYKGEGLNKTAIGNLLLASISLIEFTNFFP